MGAPTFDLHGEEVLEQFARLLELAPIPLVADFEDGIGRQLSASAAA